MDFKTTFILAYCEMFKVTENKALEVWRDATPDYLIAVVDEWENKKKGEQR